MPWWLLMVNLLQHIFKYMLLLFYCFNNFKISSNQTSSTFALHMTVTSVILVDWHPSRRHWTTTSITFQYEDYFAILCDSDTVLQYILSAYNTDSIKVDLCININKTQIMSIGHQEEFQSFQITHDCLKLMMRLLHANKLHYIRYR